MSCHFPAVLPGGPVSITKQRNQTLHQLFRKPNRNTTSKMSLEMAQSNVNAGLQPAASPDSKSQDSEAWKKDVRICLAEDNPVNRIIFTRMLKKLGYTQLDTYENGQKAVDGIRLKASEGEPYHIVFMDTQMPVLDGYHATRLIREDPVKEVRNVTIIAVQPGMSPEKALAEGMDDVLFKPCQLLHIKGTMEIYIDPSDLYNLEDSDAATEAAVISDEAGDDSGSTDLQLRPRL